MFYELQNVPSVPVTLADAKAFLRIDSDITKDDNLINDLIKAAIEWGERFTNRDFSNKQWIGFFSGLCFSPFEIYPYLSLQKSPIASVDAVEVSSNNVFSAFTNFTRKQQSSFDRLLFLENVLIDEAAAYTFKVTFQSGYVSLPSAIKSGILQHVSFLYENRADAPSSPPKQIKSIYSHFRLHSGYA